MILKTLLLIEKLMQGLVQIIISIYNFLKNKKKDDKWTTTGLKIQWLPVSSYPCQLRSYARHQQVVSILHRRLFPPFRRYSTWTVVIFSTLSFSLVGYAYSWLILYCNSWYLLTISSIFLTWSERMICQISIGLIFQTMQHWRLLIFGRLINFCQL